MKENFELYEHIYKDAEMACFTLQKLLKDLKSKDNKIKKLVEDILKEYTTYKNDVKKILKDNNKEVKDTNMMGKMMARMNIKNEVMDDNSDSSIADMLIQGISMGSIDTEKKIHDYDKEVNDSQLDYVNEFLEFQKRVIEELKSYL